MRPQRGERPSARKRPLARKRFGQHFLHDPAVIARIAQALDPRPGEHVVEIGPGRGALTRHLLESPAATVDAIEIDRDLAQLLREQLPPREGFTLHQEDALTMDFGALARQRGAPLRVVGNLPYNISTPLLFHLIVPGAQAQEPPLTDLHVMLQREVAARIAAAPGEDSYGRLTVMLAPWVHVERLFDVGPGAFQPPPKVWSSVLRLTVLKPAAFAVSAGFARVVSAGFAQRRKTLRNGLKNLLAASDIEACGVDPAARPETLAPQQWNALGKALEETLGDSGTAAASRRDSDMST